MKIDILSFKLGMIESFCEIVGAGVKKLALSPPLENSEYESMKEEENKIVEKFNVYSYVEKDFIPSDLVEDKEIENQIIILYYKDEKVLNEYLELKEKINNYKKDNAFDDEKRKETSIILRRLLSYSEEAIREFYEK